MRNGIRPRIEDRGWRIGGGRDAQASLNPQSSIVASTGFTLLELSWS